MNSRKDRGEQRQTGRGKDAQAANGTGAQFAYSFEEIVEKRLLRLQKLSYVNKYSYMIKYTLLHLNYHMVFISRIDVRYHS